MDDQTRRRFLQLTIGTFAAWPFRSAQAEQSDQLIVHSRVPMNAEPPLPALVESWITPTDRFYIRSHAPVPQIDPKQYRLRVTGLVEREVSLSLGQLEAYPRTDVTATMTCAGNRRYEHSKISPIKGVPWREGAIGNAQWSGVRLSLLLKEAGVQPNARHVWFEGLDEIQREDGVIPFGASIPLEKAVDDTESAPGALVTTQMNGEPLTPDHGWPVRTVVPGYIGARSVKWLGRIVVSDRPSPNHYVTLAYKVVRQGTELEWAEQGPIYRYPLNAVIAVPTAQSTLDAGRIKVAGYALPPGDPDASIARVRISADGGNNWTTARFTSSTEPYCWQLWQAELDVSPATTELIVMATDSEGRHQPQRAEWNLKGYLYNARHRVPIRVKAH